MMKLKHGDMKEITTTTATRNAFAAAAVLTGTLAVIAAAQEPTKTTGGIVMQAPGIKGNFQIEKMVFGGKPVKAGDTLFVATNVCDLTDRAILKVDEVQDSSVVMTSLINSTAGPKVAGQVVATRTIAYGEEVQVGAFKAKAEKGPEPGTVVVEYVITPATGCSESK